MLNVNRKVFKPLNIAYQSIGAGARVASSIITGKGRIKHIRVYAKNEFIKLEIYVNGTAVGFYHAGTNLDAYTLNDDFGGVKEMGGFSLVKYDTTNLVYIFVVSKEIPFSESIQLKLYNDQATAYMGAIGAWVEVDRRAYESD